MPKDVVTDCRSEEGITIGLIDSLMTIATVLNGRDLESEVVLEALKDLAASEELRKLIILSRLVALDY